MVEHPTQGAAFCDDSTPCEIEPVADFGRLGFNTDGYPACPPALPGAGACCFEDGSCRILTPEGCAQAGGLHQGAGTTCDPNPCSEPTPVESIRWGSLKARYR